MIEKFQRCVGVKLLRWRKWQAELWICPAGENIPLHTHPNVHSKLVFLGGEMLWQCHLKSRILKGWSDCLTAFDVPPDCVHGAEVTGKFGLFLNLERWTCEPTSAARNLTYA